MERVLLYEEALAEVLQAADQLAPPADRQDVSLAAAQGRVLAAPMRASRAQPPFARSTRDGFAVRSADLAAPGRALALIGSVRAGERWAGAALTGGQALEIMTGAPVPEGADCVLMVEHAELSGTTLRADRTLQPGENIVAAGAEARPGAELIPEGRRLGAAEIGLAASCGYGSLEVYAAPRVAIVATGDELVELGTPPEPWQIFNSNSYSLAALVMAEGGDPVRLASARDTREDVHNRLAEALAAGELILFSGGVSMGKYDLVETVLREAGAAFHFTGARIQPGRPVIFGDLPRPGSGRLPFFGLPGNPISTEVCFRLFVAPLLRALAGRTERAPQFAEARLAEDVRGGARGARFLPARVESDWQHTSVRLVPWQGSGDLAANARANGFAVLPIDSPDLTVGDTVRVLLR